MPESPASARPGATPPVTAGHGAEARQPLDFSDPAIWIPIVAAVLISLLAIYKMYPSYVLHKELNISTDHTNRKIYDEQLHDALVYLHKADPTLLDYPAALGDVCIELKKYEEALQNFAEVKKLQPGYPVEAREGICYLMLNQKDKAEKSFHDALQKNPQDPIACYYAGVAAFEAGKYPEAASFFMQTVTYPKYSALAEPYRLKIQEKVLGKVDLVSTQTLPSTFGPVLLETSGTIRNGAFPPVPAAPAAQAGQTTH